MNERVCRVKKKNWHHTKSRKTLYNLKQRIMNAMKNSPKLILLAFVFLLFTVGCKSAKKMAAANAAAEKAKMEQEANLRKEKEDELKRRIAEENARRDEASALKIMKENAPKVKLGEYFDAIANSSSTASANTSINEALTMFVSAQCGVLIIISQENGKKDYDRPTTITAYLNYLKDQKKNINSIENLKVDDSGKITEVELRKNN
jgi:hypothetical protein